MTLDEEHFNWQPRMVIQDVNNFCLKRKILIGKVQNCDLRVLTASEETETNLGLRATHNAELHGFTKCMNALIERCTHT